VKMAMLRAVTGRLASAISATARSSAVQTSGALLCKYYNHFARLDRSFGGLCAATFPIFRCN
jgi:hypothetical protein